MKIKPSQKEIDTERAIIMLVDYVKENCINPKPLILHSVRVGMKLFELAQPTEVIVAGILHDVVEDTNCTLENIENVFGKKVSDLVYALTQEKIEDYKERWHVLLGKIKKVGKPAMIIKIVDCNDNLVHFVPSLNNKQFIKEMLWKQNFTIESLKPYLSDVECFEEYRKNLKSAKQVFEC